MVWMSRLTLDWDKITLDEALKRLRKIRKKFPNKEIQFRTSCRGKGIHIIVLNLPYSFNKLIELRKQFWDDPKRIELDIERHKDGLPCNVLFNKKVRFKNREKHINTVTEAKL